MNSVVVLFLAAFAVVVVLADEKSNTMQNCAKEFNITPDEMKIVISQKENGKPIAPSENVKCFAKCLIEGFAVVNPDGALEVDKLVAATSMNGKGDEKLRAMAEKCKSVFKKNMTCDEAYFALECFMSSN